MEHFWFAKSALHLILRNAVGAQLRQGNHTGIFTDHEVAVEDNGNGERHVAFKSDNVDGVDVRKSNKRVDLSEVKTHLFKVDY